MDKDLLINAIVGVGFRTAGFADEMTKLGAARFTGNQWNEDWQWNRKWLEERTVDELTRIYERAKAPQGALPTIQEEARQ